MVVGVSDGFGGIERNSGIAGNGKDFRDESGGGGADGVRIGRLEVGFYAQLLFERGLLAAVREEVASGGGLGSFDFFIPAEQAFLPSGFVDDCDLIDRAEAFDERGIKGEQFDEGKRIGGAVRLDEDDGIEFGRDFF